jgi:putative ABC transport system permease protein
MNSLEIEGRPETGKIKDQVRIPARSVTPNYFDILGQRIVAGRNFPTTHIAPTNGVEARIAIVNEAMAERYFPSGSAVGRKFRFAGRKDKSIEIIGVVANARMEALTRQPEPEVYYCFWEALMRTKHLVIQTSANARPLILAVQRELRAIEPTVSIENVKTLEQIRSDSMASQTFAMRLLAGFSVVAMGLAVIGIYGVLSLSVASREREIAIRMAVGGQRSHVLGLILAEGMKLIGTGLLAGSCLGIALARILRMLLFGVAPADPATFLVGAMLFVAVAFMACWLPAVRATKVNPSEALSE